MELTIKLDIESAITAALQPEKLGPIVEKHITEAVKTAIGEATGYRSDFSKQLNEQIKSALPHGLGLDDMMKFQHVLNASIKGVMQGANAATIECALKKIAQDALPEVPEVIDLSEFIANARDGFHKDSGEAFYAYWESAQYRGAGDGGWLYMSSDSRPGQSLYSNHKTREEMKYSADIRLAVNGNGEVYALKFDGQDVTPNSKPKVIGNFESLLLAMYVGRTRLNIDIDDGEVESLSSEQYND